MIICPRCDGQGCITIVVVKRDKRTIFACEECEASWLKREAIGVEQWIDLEEYVKSIGLSNSSNALRAVGCIPRLECTIYRRGPRLNLVG
jgi:transcription elongation factor Elf1